MMDSNFNTRNHHSRRRTRRSSTRPTSATTSTNTTNTATDNSHNYNTKFNDVVAAAALSALIIRHQHQHQQIPFQHEYHYHHQERGHSYSYSYYSFFFDRVIPFCTTVLRILCTMLTMFVMSIMTYAILYYVILPEKSISKPIYFDYHFQHCHSYDDGVGGDNHHHHHDETLMVAATARSRSSCPPTAIIDLSQVHTQWDAYNPNIVPHPNIHNNNNNNNNVNNNDDDNYHTDSHTTTTTTTTTTNEPYDSHYYSKTRGIPHYIHVQLTLPESFINGQIGNFMVETLIKNTNHTIIASSKRPVILPFQSDYVKQWKRFFSLIYHLLGYVNGENQIITVPCFDHFLNGGRRGSGSANKEGVGIEDTYMSIIEIRLVLPSSTRSSMQSTTSSSPSPYHNDHQQQSHQHQKDQQHQQRQQQQDRNAKNIMINNHIHQHPHPPTTSTTMSSTDPTSTHHHHHRLAYNTMQPSSISIQVAKAELQIGKELNKMQYMMKEWFYTCALAFIILFMIGQLVLYAIWKCLYYGIVSYLKRQQQPSSSSMARDTEFHSNGNPNHFKYDDHDIYEYDDDSDFVVLDRKDKHDDTISQDCSTQHDNNDVVLDDDQWIPCGDGDVVGSGGDNTNNDENKKHGNQDNNTSKKSHQREKNVHSINVRSATSAKSSQDGKEDRKNNRKANQNFSGQNKVAKNKKKLLSKQKPIAKSNPTKTRTDDERQKLDRIMKGDLASYEIFTDLDDPD